MHTVSPATVYDRDLAYVHDTGFRQFSESATPGLLRVLRNCGIARGKVVDLGCGGGIWVKALVDSGYEAVGVDLSPAMIALARRRVPQGVFHTQSFLDFQFPKCHAVTALGEG